MKRTIGVAVALIALITIAFVGLQTSAASNRHARSHRLSGAIKIESWLHANPDLNGQSGTVKACAKIKINGVVVDRAGRPAWSDSTYETLADPTLKCSEEGPAGGYVLLPVPSSGPPLQTVYAVHTIPATRGDIFITFSGSYNLANPGPVSGIAPGHCTATWVITGGTGAYTGMQGEGLTSQCDASQTYPYILHTSTGQVWQNR